MFRRLLSEPFVHFALAGLVLFGFVSWETERGAEVALDAHTVTVDRDRIERLTDGFQRTWQRPPTRQELDGLVEAWIEEEIFYREALALGLDREDEIVRRRLRQKMEFLAEDIAAADPPTDAALQSYLDENPATFEVPGVVTFDQLFFDPAAASRSAESRARDARAALLEGGLDTEVPDDPTSLPKTLEGVTSAGVARTFGSSFAEGLYAVAPQEWVIVPSSFGVHLVWVREREGPKMPALDDVRAVVLREFESNRRAEAKAAFSERLRAKYAVEIQSMPVE